MSKFFVSFFNIRVLEVMAQPFVPEKTRHRPAVLYCQNLNRIIIHLPVVLQPPILNKKHAACIYKFNTT